MFATGSDDNVARIFDSASGQELTRTAEHGGVIRALCFSPDGKCISTSCSDSLCRVFTLNGGGNEKKGEQLNLNLCMVFAADRISLSAHNSIALMSGSLLRVIPSSHNFATDACLPVLSSIALEWIRLPQDLQNCCFISDSQVVLSEFFSTQGGELVQLASKWQDPEIGYSALSTLERLFNGQEPVVNAGLILRELLPIQGSQDLPHAATIEALLTNVGRHISYAARDDMLTQQLVRAACIPSIQKIISEFWIHRVHLVPSEPIVVLNVEQVTFSERTRMYVASSEDLKEPVFEKHFQQHPQSQGHLLNFEHLFIPFPRASDHRQGSSPHSGKNFSKMSMMRALVEIGDIDIFGTAAMRAIVQHKWQTFGLKIWVKEFLVYSVGLALLVVLCVRTWQSWSPERNYERSELLVDGSLAALFGAVCMRSAAVETVKIACSIPQYDDFSLRRRMLSGVYLMNFWQWLHVLHIVLGICSAVLVWVRSSNALPVLAVTSFLRWWGTLFYLQVCIHDLKMPLFLDF
jgi:hypothetical protein